MSTVFQRRQGKALGSREIKKKIEIDEDFVSYRKILIFYLGLRCTVYLILSI